MKTTGAAGGSGTVNFAEPPAGVTEIEAAAVLVFDVPFPPRGQYRFEITWTASAKPTSRSRFADAHGPASRAAFLGRHRLPF